MLRLSRSQKLSGEVTEARGKGAVTSQISSGEMYLLSLHRLAGAAGTVDHRASRLIQMERLGSVFGPADSPDRRMSLGSSTCRGRVDSYWERRGLEAFVAIQSSSSNGIVTALIPTGERP
jgi:hypothetical protein